jgi:hypothetical protein
LHSWHGPRPCCQRRPANWLVSRSHPVDLIPHAVAPSSHICLYRINYAYRFIRENAYPNFGSQWASLNSCGTYSRQVWRYCHLDRARRASCSVCESRELNDGITCFRRDQNPDLLSSSALHDVAMYGTEGGKDWQGYRWIPLQHGALQRLGGLLAVRSCGVGQQRLQQDASDASLLRL